MNGGELTIADLACKKDGKVPETLVECLQMLHAQRLDVVMTPENAAPISSAQHVFAYLVRVHRPDLKADEGGDKPEPLTYALNGNQVPVTWLSCADATRKLENGNWKYAHASIIIQSGMCWYS